MKPDEEIVGDAIRVEFDEFNEDFFIVFKITNEKYKKILKKEWATSDIEFTIINKKLVRK